MDHELAALIAAMTTFIGTHFALSHPLRSPVVRAIGERGFQAAYSLVALASFAWVIIAYRAASTDQVWNGQWNGLAAVVMLIASVLLVGSFFGNPAMPGPHADQLAARSPHGVFQITRHPMMWAFALWAAAHALISPSARSLVLTGGIALLALLGSHLQDRKKRAQMGAAWAGWAAQTSYWPRPGALLRAGLVPWLGGLALWLAASWAHGPLIAMPVGIWRWL